MRVYIYIERERETDDEHRTVEQGNTWVLGQSTYLMLQLVNAHKLAPVGLPYCVQ